MSDILVEHNSVKNDAIFEHSTWNLFNLCVSLHIDFNVVLSILIVDSSNSFDGKVYDETSPLA